MKRAPFINAIVHLATALEKARARPVAEKPAKTLSDCCEVVYLTNELDRVLARFRGTTEGGAPTRLAFTRLHGNPVEGVSFKLYVGEEPYVMVARACLDKSVTISLVMPQCPAGMIPHLEKVIIAPISYSPDLPWPYTEWFFRECEKRGLKAEPFQNGDIRVYNESRQMLAKITPGQAVHSFIALDTEGRYLGNTGSSTLHHLSEMLK